MGINEVASLFGAQFLPPDACKGEVEKDYNFLKGYPKAKLRLSYHAAPGMESKTFEVL